MATVTKEFLIAADADFVWDALRDFHAVHERIAPGFLTAATRDGDDRVLTFFNGMVARERLVGLDEATRRIAYTIVEGRFAYHAASTQVFPHAGGSRMVWIGDILPDSLADGLGAMMDHGGEAMVRTLEAAAREMAALAGGKWFGVIDPDRQRSLSGLEFVKGLVDGSLPLNSMAKTLGYDIAEAETGRVVVTAVPHSGQRNPAGTVHGGLAATLLDSCMGLAVQSTLDPGVASTTLEFKISLLRPVTTETGPMRAEGTVLSRGRRVGTAEGRLTDTAGRLLAHGTTTCLIFDAGS